MSCLDQDFRFPLKADVYYASMTQDAIGNMEKSWSLGYDGLKCELRSDKFNSDMRYAVSAKDPFLETPLLVFGRFKDDIRKKSDGSFIPITNIMVSNIRSYCTDEPIFIDDTAWSGSDISIFFELRTFQPFVNPWGDIEYYKAQLIRMENQSGIEVGI